MVHPIGDQEECMTEGPDPYYTGDEGWPEVFTCCKTNGLAYGEMTHEYSANCVDGSTTLYVWSHDGSIKDGTSEKPYTEEKKNGCWSNDSDAKKCAYKVEVDCVEGKVTSVAFLEDTECSVDPTNEDHVDTPLDIIQITDNESCTSPPEQDCSSVDCGDGINLGGPCDPCNTFLCCSSEPPIGGFEYMDPRCPSPNE